MLACDVCCRAIISAMVETEMLPIIREITVCLTNSLHEQIYQDFILFKSGEFTEYPDPVLLDFLSSLCVCNGKSIPSTQCLLIKLIITHLHDYCIYRLYFRRTGRKIWKSL